MKIKAYAVRWKESKMEENCVDEENRIVMSDDAMTETTVDFPLFKTKKFAREFANGSKDFEVVEVEINIKK